MTALSWQKVSIVLGVLALFGAMAALGKLSPETVTVGVSAALGWLGGLFTPVPGDTTKAAAKAPVVVDVKDATEKTP